MSFLRWFSVVLGIAVAGLALSGCGLMRGSEYPASDINLVVHYAPGGSADPTARVAAQEAEKTLGRKIAIINKPGASGTLGMTDVITAKPDGYTLGEGSTGGSILGPMTIQTNWGGPEDYTPIAGLIYQTAIIVVRADSPYKTFDDLVNDAKKRPREVRISVASAMDNDPLAIKQLGNLYNVNITTVPFSGGGGEAMQALLAGQVEANSAKAPTSRPLIEAGQIRPLAVLQSSGNPAFPNVPTVQKLGYNLTVPGPSYYVFGPKGMDKAVVNKLADTFIQAVKSDSFQKLCRDNGFTAQPIGPDDLVKDISNQFSVLRGLLQEVGVKPLR